MAQFEIQRILSLAYLYRELEQNHKFQHLNEDTNLIIGKIKELFPLKSSDEGRQLPETENPFYYSTETKQLYWKRNMNGSYEYSIDGDGKDYTGSEKIETVKIIGRTRDYKKNTTEIPVMHIAFRANKDKFSTIDKFLRKEHGTFDEILDQKGIIFVVEKFSDINGLKIAEMLIKILENELATLRSSWIEYPEFQEHITDNENSSSEFNVLKGIIKIPSKAKVLKSRINICQEEVNGLKKSGGFSTLRHRGNILRLETEIENLKKQFENLRYNLPLEVQIFDMD